MDDKLKPNQEKRIIENCVESIMDDLDVYHFDEKLMNKYEKQLIEFFTKISEEHSLFSPGFDFSNKKNIVNDKEKIKEVLEFIDSFLVEKGGDEVIENWDGQTPRSLLEFIKKRLELTIGFQFRNDR